MRPRLGAPEGKEYAMRKATFTKTDTGLYKPVNKRAHNLCKRAVNKQSVRGFANKNIGIYVWTNAGLRKVA
jgi:hypothetical protein